MGSADGIQGASIWPQFSSAQQGQPSRLRHLQPGCSAEMASKRKRSYQDLGNPFVGRVGQDNNLFKLDDLGENDNAMLMSAHLQMLQKFMNFCSEKKLKYDQDHADTTNPKFHEDKQYFGQKTFKDRVTSYFGEFLPSSVFDELCQLVKENSYGKCHYCCLPAESLVLSVLQILLDASQNSGSKQQSSEGVSENCIKDTHNENPGSKPPSSGINNLKGKSMNRKIPPSRVIVDLEPPRRSLLVGKHSAESSHENPFPTLDTPAFMFGDQMKSQQAPAMPVLSKWQRNRFIDSLHKPAVPPTKVGSPEVYITHETKSRDVGPNLGKLADQIYNQKNVKTMAKNNLSRSDNNQQLQMKPSKRFEVSQSEIRYYEVICGLAHSDYRGIEGVQLYKTSVTFSSLGESVEPNGHVDNFFISGYCRKLFDDNHPRASRKHYFYPRIGCCLIAYKSDYERKTVKKSFEGANSALKLHTADKLCFPIHESDHWFVFIVDLKAKSFVFLDSLYDKNSDFQVHARDNIITAFKECWYEHAEYKLGLDDFTVLYPPVPKQRNAHDCGIYAIKFMELWDINVDLRRVFDQSDIPNIRIKLANELFFSKMNSADKSIVQNYFESGFDPRWCN